MSGAARREAQEAPPRLVVVPDPTAPTAPTAPVVVPGTPTAPAERLSPTMRVLDRTVGALVAPFSRLGGRRPEGFVDRDLRCVVDAVTPLADDVVGIRFRAADGGRLPSFSPGAHVDVVLPERLGGGMRQYSLTGEPGAPSSYRIAVRRIDPAVGGGGGSVAMHALRPGDDVVLKGPRHAFPFVAAESYLFVAGGIGITPILPMLRAVVAAGEVPWALVYTGRTRAAMPFLDEIAALTLGQSDRVHVRPDDEFGAPTGRDLLALAPPGAALYTCGPVPMIEAIRAEIPDPAVDTLHYERFSPPPVQGGEPFRLRLARRGELVEVGADESALAAVLRTRPGQAYSCRQGFCGTCHVRVLAGDVEHRDRGLTPAQREDTMLLCVSRGSGEVVLDV